MARPEYAERLEVYVVLTGCAGEAEARRAARRHCRGESFPWDDRVRTRVDVCPGGPGEWQVCHYLRPGGAGA